MAALGPHEDRLLAESLDILDGDALRAHLDAAAERFGPVEILVTNGGGPAPGGPTDVTDEGLDASMDLVLRSAVRAVKHVLPGMRAAGWGRIVGLTSMPSSAVSLAKRGWSSSPIRPTRPAR